MILMPYREVFQNRRVAYSEAAVRSFTRTIDSERYSRRLSAFLFRRDTSRLCFRTNASPTYITLQWSRGASVETIRTYNWEFDTRFWDVKVSSSSKGYFWTGLFRMKLLCCIDTSSILDFLHDFSLVWYLRFCYRIIELEQQKCPRNIMG